MTVARNGFGLALDLLEGIDCEGLSAGHGAGRRPPTVVRPAEPGRLDRAWPAGQARVTRELRIGGELIFSIAHAVDAGYLLTMPAYGKFLIDPAGGRVACEPEPSAEWTTALLVQALPLACTLRGLEPFHAGGVVLDGEALMIAGPVTAGKSSLAAALVAAGARLLSDDVVAVDAPGETIRAHPAAHWLHLRGPAGEAVPRLRPAGTLEGRRRYAAPLAAGPAPLRAVYLLTPPGDETATIAPEPRPAVALLASTYNLSVREPARLGRQLELVHRMAATLAINRISMRPGTDAPRLAQLIQRHFESEVRGG